MNFDLRGQRSPRIIQYIFVNLFVQAEYIHHFSLGRYWFLMIFENLTFLVTFDTLERVGRRGHNDDFWLQLQDEQFDTLIFQIEQTCKFDLWSMNFDLWGQRSPTYVQ